MSKKLAYVEHDIQPGRGRIKALLVEVISHSWLKQSVLILNVCSRPSDQTQSFHSLLMKAASLARQSPLVIAGDFNTPHNAWGHIRHTAKGTNLARAVDDLVLTAITDPRFPTRLGRSVAREATPDLALIRNVEQRISDNKQESLGSDHFIISHFITSGQSHSGQGI